MDVLVDVDIQKLLSKINEGEQYCPICLKTARETSLVKPRLALAYTNALAIKLFTKNKWSQTMVCYMCEAASGKALKMHRALIDSLNIQDFIRRMCILKGKNSNPKLQKSAHEFHKWNLRVKKFRQSMSLRPTEILVVDSLGIQFANKPSSLVTPNESTSNLPTWTPGMETVVLEDDDDSLNAPGSNEPRNPKKPSEMVPEIVKFEDILHNKHKGKFAATFIPNQMQLLVRAPFEDNFVLHPVVLGKCNEMLIPTLSLKLEDGKLIRDDNVNDLLKPPQITIENGVISQNVVDSELTELRAKSTRTIETEDVTYIIENNIKTSNVIDIDSILKNALEREKIETIRSQNAVKRKVTGLPITSVTAGNSKSNRVVTNTEPPPLAVISSVTSTKREELPKNDRIDWEDKIPMDVISFMDAVDPATKIVVEVPPIKDPPDMFIVPDPPDMLIVPDPPDMLIVPDIPYKNNKKIKPNIKSEAEVIIDLC